MAAAHPVFFENWLPWTLYTAGQSELVKDFRRQRAQAVGRHYCCPDHHRAARPTQDI